MGLAVSCGKLNIEECMSRISIDVTENEHKRLKALAALRGKSIKDFVLERTLGANETEETSLRELEALLNERIRGAQSGAVSRRSVKTIFAEAAREPAQ